MKTQSTIVRPFSTLTVEISAPVAVHRIVESLGLEINLATGTESIKKQGALLAAARHLVGDRRPNESGAAWAARAQSALDQKFGA